MKNLFVLIVLILAMAAIGCSSSAVNPIDPTPQSDYTSNHSSSHSLWGLWQFIADPAKGSLDVTPLRGGDLHLNALKFLEPPAGINLSVSNVHINGGVIDCDVNLRHPFIGMKVYSGFDVRGILIGSGDLTGFSDPTLRLAGTGNIRLLNADGLTRWWNPVEFPHDGSMSSYIDGMLGTPYNTADFNSTLNGYKFFADDIVNPDDPLSSIGSSTRCVFSAGVQNTRHYKIDMGSAGLVFNYAVDASWKMPTGDPPYDVPDDFPPEANCPEAWNAQVVEEANTLWNNDTGSGGSLTLDIDLWDHYNAANNMIYVESPGNFAPLGPVAPTVISPDSAGFEVEITDATPAPGSIDILIIAESDSSGYQNLLPGKKVSTYFIYTAQVDSGGQTIPPVAIAAILSTPPFNPGDLIKFDAASSYDPDGGIIVSYEWDFDNDGIYGDSYEGGTDANPGKIFNDAGQYLIDVRVTDDDAETDTLDAKLIVNINVPGDYIWVDDDAVEPYLGTFDQPYPTIQMGVDAAAAVYPADSWIMVKDGAYKEEVVVTQGNVTIQGYSTPAPIVASPEPSSSDLFTINGSATNTTLKHFRMMPRTTGNGIVVTGSDVVVDDIEFIDNPGGATCGNAIYFNNSGSIGNIINDVRVNGYHKSSGGFLYASGNDIHVTNCVLLNIIFDAPSPLTVFSVHGGYSGPYPDLLVAKNVVGHIAHADVIDDIEWCTAVDLSYVSGATIRNNLLFDINNKYTSGWTWGMDIEDCSGVTMEHNTISGLQGPAWIYAMESTDWNTSPSGVIHRDHIITDLTTHGVMQSWRWAYLGMWDDTPLPVDYSCAYNSGNAFYSGIHDVVEGVGFTTGDPQFLDTANDDYRVTAGSVASGTAHDGTDMGAYGGSDPLTWLP